MGLGLGLGTATLLLLGTMVTGKELVMQFVIPEMIGRIASAAAVPALLAGFSSTAGSNRPNGWFSVNILSACVQTMLAVAGSVQLAAEQ